MSETRAVLFGVGAVGSLIAKHLLKKKGIRVVGAVDASEEMAGRDLAEVLETSPSLGVQVSRNAETVLKLTEPDIVIHATSSYLHDVFPQLSVILEHGVNIVSTCEELSYPYYSEPQLAKKIDALAKRNEATVLGTGINPGFLMDTLVIALSAVCQKIEEIEVVRVINAATRRVPFQRKIGAGLSVKAFEKALRAKQITGHVGLAESISSIASALGLKLDHIHRQPIAPIIAQSPTSSEVIHVETGQVSGLRQTAIGRCAGKDAITLRFSAYIGAEEEHDAISIKGLPNVTQRITPCVNGDIGTVAIIVNAIPKVISAPPGLVTMKDLPPVSATMGL